MKSEQRSVKTKVDGLKSVDLRVLRRAGALLVGCVSVIQWFRQGHYLGEFQVTAATDQLTISYSTQHNVTQIVKLTYTPCHFGSQRPWMACPRCSSRVMLLYVAATGLGCRHCFNLTYQSRNEGHVANLSRSVRNARVKVGAAPDLTKPLPPKPKWKHHEKYNRLRQQAEMHEIRFFGSMDEKLQLMPGLVPE